MLEFLLYDEDALVVLVNHTFVWLLASMGGLDIFALVRCQVLEDSRLTGEDKCAIHVIAMKHYRVSIGNWVCDIAHGYKVGCVLVLQSSLIRSCAPRTSSSIDDTDTMVENFF